MAIKLVSNMVNITQLSSVFVGAMASVLIATNTIAQEVDIAVSVSEQCPTEFYQLPLFPGAKLCQVFADGMPASMIYHASADQQTTQMFYQQKLGEADKVTLLKGRILMEYADSKHIIVISKDGNGSQVDVLVKST